MKKKFPYSIVEKISFRRCAGTEEEKRAAEIIKEEIEKMGGQAEYMPFTFPDSEILHHAVKINVPYEEEVDAVPYGRSGSFPEGGADLKLYYAENGGENDFRGITDLSDTAVLVNEFNPEIYARLCEKKAAAFLVIAGKYYDTLETANVYGRNLRPHFLEKGVIPGFLIGAGSAVKMVCEEVETIHLELQQKEKESESQNILAVIPGTEMPEESIVLTAHYDSVPVGNGVWDNATGTAALLYVYRYFLEHPAKRTMRFVWCGSEEVGLLGSKAYVATQEDAMKEIHFCFNFDMCGAVLGTNSLFVTGGDELKIFAEQFCRETGHRANIRVMVHSSDSAPFADKGVPAIGIFRGSTGAEYHTRYDRIDIISEKQIRKDAEFAVKMVSRVANSEILPVDMGMNDEMKKELDKYFHRETKKEEKTGE